MSDEILTKELVRELMRIEGEARGIHFKNDADFILKEKSEVDLKKVEEELKKNGCPLKYKNIKNLGFYPIGWRAISLLAIQKVFSWNDEDMRKLGKFATNVSFIIRLYMKFFYSIEMIVNKAPKIWSEYFTKGQLAISDYNEKEKYAIIEIKNFALHPVYCRVLEGYFENFIKMITKTKEAKCQEKKCTFTGQDCHQFEIIWK